MPLIGIHRAALARVRSRFGITEGWVLPSSGGLPVPSVNVGAAWRRFLRRRGLPRFSPHKLRRTPGSLLLDMGVPVNVVAAILGHSGGAVTLGWYADVVPARRAMRWTRCS